MATCVLQGCSKFLDIVPKDKQTAEQLYATKGGVYIAVNGIYNGISASDLYGRVMTYEALDIMSRRYTVNPTNTYFNNLAGNSYGQSTVASTLSRVWQRAYELILASNILMEQVHKQEGVLSPLEAGIIEGEMLAVRAFLHFDMLRLFGPRWNDNPDDLSIPYNESTKVTVLPLLPFSQIKDNIIRDLNRAEELLANDPVIARGPMAFEEENESVQLRYRQFRFNYYGVKALKARVYLYCGDKVNALIAAKALLEDPKVHQHFPPVDPIKLLSNLTDPDRVFSSEVLTGIYFKNRDQAFTSYFGVDVASATQALQPRANYLTTRGNLFELGGASWLADEQLFDYRAISQWERAAGGFEGHVFTKYKSIRQPAATADNPEPEHFFSRMISLLRLSEVFYIAAECEPTRDGAFHWLNIMRVRRGLPEILPATFTAYTDAQFANIISMEYLREFFGEGQIFFYFKRLARNMSSGENGVAAAAFNYTEAAYKPPLPTREMK